MDVKISDAGLSLIKEFETCVLTAYPDPGTGLEPWTIGWGHTGGVSPSDVITSDEAEKFLRDDLEKFEKCVSEAVAESMTQNQFDACVSLAFNIGCNAFRKSTLVRKYIEGDEAGAAEQFLRWDKAGGKVMAGLTRRRKAERELFLS